MISLILLQNVTVSNQFKFGTYFFWFIGTRYTSHSRVNNVLTYFLQISVAHCHFDFKHQSIDTRHPTWHTCLMLSFGDMFTSKKRCMVCPWINPSVPGAITGQLSKYQQQDYSVEFHRQHLQKNTVAVLQQNFFQLELSRKVCRKAPLSRGAGVIVKICQGPQALSQDGFGLLVPGGKAHGALNIVKPSWNGDVSNVIGHRKITPLAAIWTIHPRACFINSSPN